VSSVTIAVSSPSAAAGAQTNYQVGFKTSSSGGLSGAAGSKITIVLDAATGFTAYNGGSPVVVGSTTVGQCSHNSGSTLSCYIYNGSSIAASTTVAITLLGVTNPPANSYTLTVSTTSDLSPVTSPTYTITAAHPLTNVTVAAPSPSTAAGAQTNYQIGFKTSSTGGLAGSAGSRITIVLAAGTGFGAYNGGSPVVVGTTTVGQCTHTTGTTLSCYIYNGSSIAASTTVAITLLGVTNPTTAGNSNTLTVATTSDTSPITSPTYTITAAKSVTSASAATSSSLPSATAVTYTLKVKTSSTGALAGNAGSKIAIVLPAGTGFGSFNGSSPVKVGTTQVGQCTHTTGTTLSCYIYNGSSVAASTTTTISLLGLTNPATPGVYTATVSTTSDVTTKASSGYCIVAAGVPCIAGFTPASGGVGAGVTITGVNLSGATALSFNGKAAAILTNTATKITTTVPAGATTGTISVTTGGGTAVSVASFKVIKAPKITGFSPSSGAVGTVVTISGTNLGKATSLTFNGVAATITTDSASTITAAVPAGATTGPIAVTTAGGTGTSGTNFTVT
jgi:hypothetical protein